MLTKLSKPKDYGPGSVEFHAGVHSKHQALTMDLELGASRHKTNRFQGQCCMKLRVYQNISSNHNCVVAKYISSMVKHFCSTSIKKKMACNHVEGADCQTLPYPLCIYIYIYMVTPPTTPLSALDIKKHCKNQVKCNIH